MAQEIIDVGSEANDGQGDPLRTAFIKTNNNFSELYSTYATTTYVNNQINNLIGGAPGTLDTLNEIAAALSDDDNVVNALIVTVSTKANTADLSNVAFTGSYNDLTNKPVLTTGYTGSIGFTGSQGTTGFVGSQGDLGYTGSVGFTGSQGVIGYTGSTGIFTNTTISTAIGSPGDTQFKVAVDNTYIYYCTANYDGSTNVWKRIEFSANTW